MYNNLYISSNVLPHTTPVSLAICWNPESTSAAQPAAPSHHRGREFPGERAKGRGRRQPSTRCTCPGCAAGAAGGIPGCRQGSPAGSDTTRRDATGPGGRSVRQVWNSASEGHRTLIPGGRSCRGRAGPWHRPIQARLPDCEDCAMEVLPDHATPPAACRGDHRREPCPQRAGRQPANPSPATGSKWPEPPRLLRTAGTVIRMGPYRRCLPSGSRGSGEAPKGCRGRLGKDLRGLRGGAAAVGEGMPAGGASDRDPSAIRRTSDSGPN